MRVLLLLLLAASLSWLALRSCGSTGAAESREANDDAGYLLPTDVVLPSPPADRAQGVEGATAARSTAGSAGSVPVGTVSSASDVSPMSSWEVDSMTLASELLHSPRSLIESTVPHLTACSSKARVAVALAEWIVGHEVDARQHTEPLLQDPEIEPSERALLATLVEKGPQWSGVLGVSHETEIVQAATMAILARKGESAFQQEKFADAADIFSDLLLEEVNAPWPADGKTLRHWTDRLLAAQRRHRWSREGDWPSIEVEVRKGESLISVRKRVLDEHPEMLLCTGLIRRANELGSSTLQPGQRLRVPTDRAQMVVDIDARWALFLLGDEVASAWEIGVGEPGNETRPGNYIAGEKTEEPMWFPAGKDPVPFGDPENPLGTRWIAWMTPDGRPSRLGFHGTKDPESIGRDLSQGCVRLRNPDMEELFEILPKGSVVRVQR
jgi:hypothetical protein